MGLKHAIIAAISEKLPLGKFADHTGDGDLELVIGPQDGIAETLLRHVGGWSVQLGPIVFVLGGE